MWYFESQIEKQRCVHLAVRLLEKLIKNFQVDYIDY
jgi:hypothetical protein